MLFYTVLVIISVLAVLPDYDNLPELASFSDKLNHVAAFAVLFILFEPAHPGLDTSKRFFLLFFYALMIEIVQYFLPTRTADIYDIAADTAGILVGGALIPLLRTLPFCSHYCH
jgi:VanZ family protein